MWRCGLVVVASCGRIDFDPGASSRLHVGPLPAETLVDFPLLVVLDDTRADRTLIAPDASDMRFYGTDGTVLADEIEQAGSPGGAPLLAWVRLPSVASSIDLTVEYGHSPRATSSDSAWSDSYAAVWHLDGSGDVPDSTTNDVGGVATGTTPVAGQIGGARLFDNTDPDSIAVPGGKTLALPVVTVSGWISPTSLSSTNHYALVSRESFDSGDDDFWLADTIGGVAGDEFETDASGDVAYTSTYPVDVGRWTHLAATADGAQEILYADGVAVGSGPLVGPLLSDPNPIFLGADRNGTAPEGEPDIDFANGELDEIRIETVARSQAWITADDLSQRDQLITYGPVLYGAL